MRKILKLTLGMLIMSGTVTTLQSQVQPAAPAPAQIQAPRAPSPNANLISAETLPGNKVIFRIYAPEAKTVSLTGDVGANSGAKFTKDSVGVWSATYTDVKSGVYRYAFMVDGIRVSDPRSQTVTEASALLEVKGDVTPFWAMKDVPHGDVRTVWYLSATTKTTRRAHIYTPPGYDKSTESLPVLYLIHGGGDNDYAWTGVGMANFILDNLLADGKIARMIVVMPNGSVADDVFTNDLMKDLIPYVEKNYRVKTGKDNRALMGLSMGGLETLNTGIPNNSQFAYIIVLSSGWRTTPATEIENGETLLKQYANDVNKNVKLFMLTQGGQEDIAWKNCQEMLKLFDKYGLKYKYSEKPGGHTWYTWRDNLYEISQLLFK